jgi:CysZ protein
MLTGAGALLAGMRLLFGKPELRAVLWRMIALLFVLMILLSSGVFWLADYIASLWIPDGDAWYWQLLSWLVWLLAVLLAVVSGLVAYVALGSAVAAPWLDTLAARTERLCGHSSEENQAGWLQQSLQSLANSVRPFVGLLIWAVAALLCFWLPPLATAIWAYGGMRFLSFELIDTAASRRGWNFAQRKQTLNEKRWFYFGFSGLASILLIIPVLNLFVIPAAVVGLSQHMAKGSDALPH